MVVPRLRSSGAWPAWRPLKAPRGPARTRRWVLPPALGGSQLPGQPHSETKMAVRGTLWRPPLAIVHLSHQAWGAAYGSFITRPRTLYGGSDRETRAGLGGRPLTTGAPDHARPMAGGCRPAAPSEPGRAAPAPGSPLVPGLGAGGSAGGRLRTRMERGGERGQAAAVSLAPSRPAPTLFNCGRPRADTPHGLTAWLRRPGQ